MTAWAHLHLVATIVVGAAFLVSGATKLRATESTRETFAALGLPGFLQKDVIARLYSVGEIVVGVALLALPAPLWWVAAAAGLALMGVLTVLVVRVVRAGDAVACNCFGSTQLITSRTVVRNAALSALALATVIADPRTTAPVLDALASRPGELLAVVAAVLTSALVTALIVTGPARPRDAETYEDRMLEVPDVSVRDADGHPLPLSRLTAGGPVLLVHVKTGCGPCARVIDAFGDGDLIAGRVRVRLMERMPAAETLGPDRLWDDSGRVARLLGLASTPSALLIAANGTIPADPVQGTEQIFALVAGIEEAVATTQPKRLGDVDL